MRSGTSINVLSLRTNSGSTVCTRGTPWSCSVLQRLADMDPYASEQFLTRDLGRLSRRIAREGWRVRQDGLVVEALLPRRSSNEHFRLLLICRQYPRQPMVAAFLPETGTAGKWPLDGEYVFRSNSPVPFICLPGLSSYSPEEGVTANPYSREDLRIGAVLGRIADALNEGRCAGCILREPI